MTPTTIRPSKWSTAPCGLLLCVAALLSAAPASADEVDDAFIASLTQNGIAMSDGGSAIAMARSICAGFDKGRTSTMLAMKLMKDTGLSRRQAGYFIGAAVSAYCPQYKGTYRSSGAPAVAAIPVDPVG